MKSKGRIYYFDYLKVFAIFLVVFNHTENRGFFLFADQLNSIMFFPYMLFSIADKIAVPLLFMLSGALLLEKQESIKQLWKKRILKYLIIIILFSFVRYLFDLATENGQNFTLLGFFRYIYAAPMEIPYCFLYTYLAGLIMLPFLRAIAKNLTEQEFKYLICLQLLITGVLPIFEYVFRLGSVNLEIPIVTNSIIFYMLLGYYLHNKGGVLLKNKTFMLILWIMAILTLVISAGMVMYQYQLTGILSENYSQTFFTIFTPILAAAVFLGFQKIEKRVNRTKKHRVLGYFSNAVLGIYLLEEMARILLDSVYTLLKPMVGSFIACWIWIIVVVVVTATIANILRKVPLLKKVL